MIRFLTAGESHGKGLVVIVEGLPAGLSVNAEEINAMLRRRQGGFGRGGRMQIEVDRVDLVSGVRHGKTTGGPVAMFIQNLDHANWTQIMSVEPTGDSSDEEGQRAGAVTRPRPGHADLAGGLKYNLRDMRDVLERSSARETAARTACGGLLRQFLKAFQIELASHVVQIGPVVADSGWIQQVKPRARDDLSRAIIREIESRAEASPVRCADPEASEKMVSAISRAGEEGDTLGGVFELVAVGVPPGLGSYVHWDRRLDTQIAASIMSINGVKGVEIGLGFKSASLPGSQVHDEIYFDSGYRRPTNNAGGIEGGVSNGEPIVVRAAMKPIATLKRPLRSVNIHTKVSELAHHERSDVCAVPAAGVVGEAMLSFVLANAFLEKFGGDSIGEVERNYRGYLEQISRY